MGSASGGGTGRRLGWLLTGYFGAVLLVIVLAPFRFALGLPREVLVLPQSGMVASDLLLNLVLFVPLGFLLERLGRGRWSTMLVTALGVALAALIETAQLFLPERWTTVSDVVANGTGAWIGATISFALRTRAERADGLIGALFLDLPLVGLAWLLLPPLWLEALVPSAAGGPLLPVVLASAGGVAIAGAVRSSSGTRRILGTEFLSFGWLALGVAPYLERASFTAALMVFANLATTLATVAMLRSTPGNRRLEPRAVVVIGVLLLPWLVQRAPVPAPDLHFTRDVALEWLAWGAMFTVLGYAVSEWRGRSGRRWPLSALLPGGVAILAVVGSSAPGWSAVGAGLIAAFGSLLYDVQLEHVIARRLHGARATVSG